MKGVVHTSCVVTPAKYSQYAIDWFDAFLKDDAEAKAGFIPGGALSKDKNRDKYESKNW